MMKQPSVSFLHQHLLYLFYFVILSQQSIRTVGDTHGDDAHGADHYHRNIHIGEDSHDSGSFEGK